MENMKLGKLPPRLDSRTLMMASYMKLSELPPIPRAHSQAAKVTQPWGMGLNDVLGTCGEASKKHLIHCWTADSGREYVVPDEAVLEAYMLDGGYDPQDPMTDNGVVLLDALQSWRKVGIGGRCIDVYGSLNPKNKKFIKAGIYLFGGLYVGLAMPVAWQRDTVWKNGIGEAYEKHSWGGHCVPLVAYDDKGLTCVTWGELKRITWSAFAKYSDEAYALISSRDWITDNYCPEGFDLQQLEADLKAITG